MPHPWLSGEMDEVSSYSFDVGGWMILRDVLPPSEIARISEACRTGPPDAAVAELPAVQ